MLNSFCSFSRTSSARRVGWLASAGRAPPFCQSMSVHFCSAVRGQSTEIYRAPVVSKRDRRRGEAARRYHCPAPRLRVKTRRADSAWHDRNFAELIIGIRAYARPRRCACVPRILPPRASGWQRRERTRFQRATVSCGASFARRPSGSRSKNAGRIHFVRGRRVPPRSW